MPRGTAFFHTTGEKSGLETRTIAFPPLPYAPEADLDKSINRRLADPWPKGAGSYFASVDYPGLPAVGLQIDGIAADTIRRAVKSTLLENTRSLDPPDWVDVEMHLRADLGEIAGNTFAMIVLRTDAQRNIEIAFAGISIQGKGAMAEPDAVKSELKERYGVIFVEDDAQNVRLLDMKQPTTFRHQAWDRGSEVALLRSALGLLGGTEKAIVRGIRFRRLQGDSYKGVAGFYHIADNSVNFFDAALPISMDAWDQIGANYESGGVRTALHEIGHALAKAQPAGTTVSIQQEFQNAVLAEWQGRSPPAHVFPPPPHIPLPTTYARTGWGEFFAETYSIFRINPRFLQTPEYQYLYNFFAPRFP